jgi:DNA-directed RNA polymerase specialized sigma24 family protein
MDETTDELDRRGAELLVELAEDPTEECRRQFDALYYELVWRYLRASNKTLGARVANYLKVDGVVATGVPEEDVAEVAHEATLIALRRVREKAWKFEPSRGTATGWVIGAAEFAWVEVAKAIVTARQAAGVPIEDLLDTADPGPSTEEHVIRHLQDEEALADAASHVGENEWNALRLVVTAGYSYKEVATMLFGDEAMTKRVDRLLQSGKAKLAEAWKDRCPSPSRAGSANLADRTDDKEGTDG